MAGKVQHILPRAETPQAVDNGGTFFGLGKSVTSGCSGMRLPRHDGFPEKVILCFEGTFSEV